MTAPVRNIDKASPVDTGKVLTANRLRDGEVVFLTRSGQWSERIDDAVAGARAQAAAALELRGEEAVRANLVTGAYLFDAERRDGRVRALHIRERIRTLGPTVRLDLGKQAEGAGGGFRRSRSVEPCIAMTSSTIDSSPSAPRNSATRPSAASRAS